jgi:hypothetical protein
MSAVKHKKFARKKVTPLNGHRHKHPVSKYGGNGVRNPYRASRNIRMDELTLEWMKWVAVSSGFIYPSGKPTFARVLDSVCGVWCASEARILDSLIEQTAKHIQGGTKNLYPQENPTWIQVAAWLLTEMTEGRSEQWLVADVCEQAIDKLREAQGG